MALLLLCMYHYNTITLAEGCAAFFGLVSLAAGRVATNAMQPRRTREAQKKTDTARRSYAIGSGEMDRRRAEDRLLVLLDEAAGGR